MAELVTHEEVDLHSLDGGLGTDSLQTVKDVRFNSLLLKNTWQCVLGYLKLGKRDLFVERRLEDLIVALDGASDEQFLACRNLMLKEIRSLANRGFGPARRETRKAVLGRTLEAARQTWPRLASRLEGRDWAGDQG